MRLRLRQIMMFIFRGVIFLDYLVEQVVSVGG